MLCKTWTGLSRFSGGLPVFERTERAKAHLDSFFVIPADVGVNDLNELVESVWRCVPVSANPASEGPSWVSCGITNPATGMVQTKMPFVVELEGLYLGCGIYKSLAA